MRILRRGSIVLLWVLPLLLAGCQPFQSPASGLPRVLAIETFLQDMAQNVAGDRLKIDSLLLPTVDPHEYQPKPLDVVRLAQSQVLIVNGLGYEVWLQKTLDNLGGQRGLITATEGLSPAGVTTGGVTASDPHMWMDPLNVIAYANQIRDGLSLADPTGKDVFATNAETYISEIQALDGWIKDQVAQIPAERRLLVTNHDALGYFARAYGFTVVGAVIPSLTPDAAPSARQIVELIQAINASNARAIFLDLGENENLAQQIASETKVKVVTDLYVESLSGPGGPAPTYIDMMKHDVNVIVDALK